MRNIFQIVFILIFPLVLQAQTDSSFVGALTKGNLTGQVRLMSITTWNKAELSDYSAGAVGLTLGYQTLSFKGFRLTISGSLTQQLYTPTFSIPDPKTLQLNRYEWGMFDFTNPNNKDMLLRLQELNLQYRSKKIQTLIGNYLPQNIFLNAQDGRMSPTLVQGLSVKYFPSTKWQIGLEAITGLNPRSAVKWVSVANSFGIYPVGLNPDGTKSQYASHTTTNGIGIAEVTFKPNSKWQILASDILVENVFHTAYLKTEYRKSIWNNQQLLLGGLLAMQEQVGNGGSMVASQVYFTKENKPIIVNARLGLKDKKWEGSLNFGRITAQGRFQMPREWGVEQFYTFIPRERNEGSGDVWAYTAKYAYTFSKNLKLEAAYGYYNMPDVRDTRLNKYGVPDYSHTMLNLQYSFEGNWKGLTLQALGIYKANQGLVYDNLKYVQNKVDMSQLNLVVNYKW